MNCSIQSSTLPERPQRDDQALVLYQTGVSRLREAGIINPELESSLLLAHLLQISRAEIFIFRQSLSESLITSYHDLLARRCNREPLAYLIGEWEFWSLPFTVSPEVLIPRPETEVLVEQVLNIYTNDKVEKDNQPLSILDMGAGSGIISIVLARELAGSRIYSLDIDRKAQEVARENAGRHNVLAGISFLRADWLQAFCPGPLFDLIVANPPYVAGESFAGLQAEVRDFEPRIALDGGEKGMEEIQRFSGDLAALLKPGGYFFMEIGADQKDEVTAVFSDFEELGEPVVFNDYAGLPRVFRARKK